MSWKILLLGGFNLCHFVFEIRAHLNTVFFEIRENPRRYPCVRTWKGGMDVGKEKKASTKKKKSKKGGQTTEFFCAFNIQKSRISKHTTSSTDVFRNTNTRKTIPNTNVSQFFFLELQTKMAKIETPYWMSLVLREMLAATVLKISFGRTIPSSVLISIAE